MKIKLLTIKGNNIKEIVDIFKKEIEQRNLDSAWYSYNSNDIYFLGEEIFFNRIESVVFSFIIFKICNENECEINLISSGGQGMPIGLGFFDAENSNIKKTVEHFQEICKEKYWTLIE